MPDTYIFFFHSQKAGNYESSSCGSQGTTPSPNSSNHHHHHHHHQLVAPPSPTALLGSQTTPVLLESQVQRLADAAERLAANLRPLNPKPPSGIKKKICKNLEVRIDDHFSTTFALIYEFW